MPANRHCDRFPSLWRERRGLEAALQLVEWDQEAHVSPGCAEVLAPRSGAPPSATPFLAYADEVAQEVYGVRAASVTI